MKHRYFLQLAFAVVGSLCLHSAQAQYSYNSNNANTYSSSYNNSNTYTNSHSNNSTNYYNGNTNGNGGGPGTGNGATNIHEPKNPNGAGFYHDKYDNGIGNDHQDEGITKNRQCAPIDGGLTMAIIAGIGFAFMKTRESRLFSRQA